VLAPSWSEGGLTKRRGEVADFFLYAKACAVLDNAEKERMHPVSSKRKRQ